jgi:hypothetical protein
MMFAYPAPDDAGTARASEDDRNFDNTQDGSCSSFRAAEGFFLTVRASYANLVRAAKDAVLSYESSLLLRVRAV